MGFSGDEFLRMREMESYSFDYYEPVMCDRHYWFDVEADSKEEAIEKAKEIVDNGNVYDSYCELIDDSFKAESTCELYLDNELIKKFEQ